MRMCGAGARFEARAYAAFLQNAKNVAGWIHRVCTLGWYAMPLQGMGFETGSGHGIGNGSTWRQNGIETY